MSRWNPIGTTYSTAIIDEGLKSTSNESSEVLNTEVELIESTGQEGEITLGNSTTEQSEGTGSVEYKIILDDDGEPEDPIIESMKPDTERSVSAYIEEEEEGKTEMSKIFDSPEVGATDTHLAKVYYEATLAKKVEVVDNEYDPDTGLNTPIYQSIPDHRVRIMAANSIAKMKGHFSDKAMAKKKRRTDKVFVLVQ